MVTQVQGALAIDADFVLETEVGVANGVAGLDGSGKVPAAQLPPGSTGALTFQGAWDASTNTPTLASGVGNTGDYYVVSVDGSTNLDGITDWKATDWATFNGTVWQKVDNTDTGAAVLSVFTRTGAIVAAASDYDASQVDNDSGVTGAQVSDALDTLDSGKSDTGHGHTLADVSDSGALAALDTVGASEIDAGAVDNTKAADMAQATVKGRASGAGTGDPTDLTPAQARTVLNVADGANNYVHPNHTGDVTSTGDGATVIVANAVTNAKRATLAADRIRGRANGGGAGDTEDLTPAQVRIIINADEVAINNQTGTSYTLVIGDAGGYIRMNNASANTMTVPPNSSEAFDVNTKIHVRQVGAGQTTIVEGAGVTISTPETLVLAKQHATVTLVKTGTDAWDLMGNLTAS